MTETASMQALGIEVSPALLELSKEHPDVLQELLVLQCALARQLACATSTSSLNAIGQQAFDALNHYAESLANRAMSSEARSVLDECLDDVRLTLRARAELQMMLMEQQRQAQQ